MPPVPSTGLAAALGIDAGTSATRWRLVDAGGATVAEGEVRPLSGIMLVDKASEADALAAVAALAEAVAAKGSPGAIVAGVTGLSAESAAAGRLGETLAGAIGLARERVRVVDDMHVCYRGLFRPGEGILVYAGTGSIAYHLTAAGEVVRAGGHGYLIDDAGGGFWIGRQGLKRILRERDECLPPSTLARFAEPTIGRSWEEGRGFIYGGGRGAVASLAPLVAEAAKAGDAAAARILEEAGAELARLARVLIGRLGSLPVALAGGAARLGPLLWDGFQAGLPQAIRAEPHERPPVEAAARLALEQLDAIAAPVQSMR
jgi:N-acetylglucosamine kinase-like BadF-type ATPase